MRFLKNIFLPCVVVMSTQLTAQQIDYKVTSHPVEKINVFDPDDIKPAYRPVIQNLEAPAPDGDSYRSALLRFKKESEKKWPRKASAVARDKSAVSSPDILADFGMQIVHPVYKDSLVNISGGIPLDNTLAISNDDYLLCGINTQIYMRDLSQGYTATRDNIKVVNFTDFASPITTSSPFDPKILYDEDNDRFIVTYLTGRTPSNSGIILAFSSTSDPTDPWNVYKISGNPLNNNTWTDYPAFAMTENELFLTVNLLIPGLDWKTGFSETLIWQFDKGDGYSGQPQVTNKLWSGISLNGRNIRNLAPVQGGDSLHGPNMFFLSNRNFDLQNDSIFIVEITDEINEPSAKMNIAVYKADEPYGLPPNGRQANDNPNDTTDGFDTNDSRVLGSYKIGDRVHFVGNTKDFQTGNAAVYHGIINNISTNPVISASVIGDPNLDFGYPNIAYAGRPNCEEAALIAFDHTSTTEYAGVSALSYKDGDYSDIIKLKVGEGYVDSWLAGSYERWGDYFGIQRKFNDPGVIWTAGFYGLASNQSATWISEVHDLGCFGVGIDKKRPQTEQAVSMFPNPANEEVQLVFNMDQSGIVDVMIYSIDGKVVDRIIKDQSVKAGKNMLRFNTSPLTSGTYVVRLFSSGAEVFSDKLIVK